MSRFVCAYFAIVVLLLGSGASADDRPNILIAFADDWSWPHASIHGAKEIHTPNFDRVARNGILFHNAFTAAPQCSPNRAAILTGRNIWQIDEAGTHNSIFPKTYPVFTSALEDAGYHIGYTGKPWAPGSYEDGGWNRNPVGPEYNDRRAEPPTSGINNTDYAANFDDFLQARPGDEPFFFWYGAKEPHLTYEQGSGVRSGKNPDNVDVPDFLPDEELVRSDLLDYFVEIEWFDRHLGQMLDQIEALGELENTLVIVTSDNGNPFPRAKANLYEYGTHVPLAVQWPAHIDAGGESKSLVTSISFGPTILEAAGCAVPNTMTGQNLLPHFLDTDVSTSAHLLTGRERHSHARYDNWGYPGRAIRTDRYLYIWNMKPDRWPAGDPDQYYDVDNSPTKSLMQARIGDGDRLALMAFGKRPEEELFDITSDPECMNNLAAQTSLEGVRSELRATLEEMLREQGDPRLHGKGDIFESYPRYGGMRPELGGFAVRGAYNPAYQDK